MKGCAGVLTLEQAAKIFNLDPSEIEVFFRSGEPPTHPESSERPHRDPDSIGHGQRGDDPERDFDLGGES